MPRDRILILGGTRDARQIAEVLVAAGHCVTTSLAGVTRQPARPPGEVRTGGFGGAQGLKSYLEINGIAVVVDATHPFAARMSEHAFEACGSLAVPLLRFERQAWTPSAGDDWHTVPTAITACNAIPSGARVLLTTGRKDFEPFFARADVSGVARMIEAPSAAPPSNWQVLRARPPFTLESEKTLMQARAITHLVTKNAGGDDTAAKLEAAKQLGIRVVMIGRPGKPEVPAFASVETLVAAVKRLLSP